MAELTHIDLGRCSYKAALDAQLALWERIALGGEDRAFLLLVEHDPPVITLGRRSNPEHLLASRERLAEAGVELHEATRGGSVTWHGPGQLVGYPIMRLTGRPGGLHGYIRGLEEAIIRLAGRFDIQAGRVKGATGVWVGQEKLAAIGVAVKRWVTYHGFALNVCPDMKGFGLIVPCGLAGCGVTSLTKLLGRPVSVEETKPRMIECFAEAMGFGKMGTDTDFPPKADLKSVSVPFVPSLGIGLPVGASSLSTARDDEHTQQQKQQQQDTAKMAVERMGKMPMPRLPPWFRRRMPSMEETAKVRGLLAELDLATVCSGAKCPNIGECFACGTATFLILGKVCTRNCRFCAIPHGMPAPPREDECDAVAQACKRMGLRHAVITCVTRDDLPDGGAAHFAKTIQAVRRELPGAAVEVLTSDFAGQESSIRTVLEAGPDIFNHNIETVPRLYPLVRPAAEKGTDTDCKQRNRSQSPFPPRANYRRSLAVLAMAKQWVLEETRTDTDNINPPRRIGVSPRFRVAMPPLRIKSGIMVGLGETHEEVLDVFRDLRAVGCELLTVGQYLAPSREHVPVARFVPPDEFEQFRREALALGFAAVASGPMVRSSYQAEKLVKA